MNQDFRCGDSAALIGFLYQDCEPEERVQMAEHLAVCADCAAELESLAATRQQLSSWTPPETSLGFQLTSTESQATASVLTGPRRWWSQPLPAWAQLAAAVVIFGAGLAIGTAQRGSSRTVAVAPVPTPVMTAQIGHLEQRLQELERTAAQPVSHTLDESATNALMKRMQADLNRRDVQWRQDLSDSISSLLTDQYYQQVNTDKRMREALSRDQFKVGLITNTNRASD